MPIIKSLHSAGLLALLAVSPAALAASGEDVADGQYPFMVSIQKIALGGSDQQRHWCGGTLVAPGWVLTSARCIYPFTSAISHPSELQVVAGRTVLGNPAQGQQVGVAALHLHPRYNPTSSQGKRYDVALVQLAAPVVGIEPVALPAADDADFEQQGVQFDSLGWNTSLPHNNSGLVERMQQVQLSYVPSSQCQRAMQDGLELCVTDLTQVGAVCDSGEDSQPADPGAPLFTRIPGVGPLQLGTFSQNYRCSSLDNPSLFTRLANPEIADFISTTLGLD